MAKPIKWTSEVANIFSCFLCSFLICFHIIPLLYVRLNWVNELLAMPSSWRQPRLHDEISTEWKNVTVCWEYESLDGQSGYPSVSRIDRRIIIVPTSEEMVMSLKAILTVSDFWGRHISSFLLCFNQYLAWKTACNYFSSTLEKCCMTPPGCLLTL